MNELHLTKKDFKIEWFSGTGAGGQYRNKHQNCCRITHLESGLMSTGQSFRDRPSNQKQAFTNLAKRVIAYYMPEDVEERVRTSETIRSYNEKQNKVTDHRNDFSATFSDVVTKKNLGIMIERRNNE